ncbi:MAG: hypothetical protein JO040_04240 [Gemmatimonadetes bacterium]|nr:hypothetical protein [Gemmatimonadota bacterium]
MRGLGMIASNDVRRHYIERIVERAGVELSPAAAWLLIRVEEAPALDTATLARQDRLDPARMEDAARELRERGLVEVRGEGRDVRRELTPRGCEVLERLVTARRERLSELLSDWTPEQREELTEVLRRLSRDLVPDAPRAS